MKIEVIRTESGQDVPDTHEIPVKQRRGSCAPVEFEGATLVRVGSVKFHGRLGIFEPPPPCSGMCGRVIVQGEILPDPNVFS